MKTLSTRRSTAILLCLASAITFYICFAKVPASQAGANAEGSDLQPSFQITPAGRLLTDASTGLPAIAPLTMNFVRSPDARGPNGKGRYLIAVNSGYGLEFNSKSKPQQTLSVIDLNATPDPQIIQTIYFPDPQSANFGLAFDPNLQFDGKYRFYVSGGFENKIWIMSLDPTAKLPVSPQNKPDEKFTGPSIDVAAFAQNAPSSNYNSNTAAVYPTGIAVSPDGGTIYSANNLGDTLGIVSDIRDTRRIERISLNRSSSSQFLYPYDVKLLASGKRVAKAYVSLWGDASIAVVNPQQPGRVGHIAVDRHPTAMLLNQAQSRLYVVNSNADSISVIDTSSDRVIESINVRLSESARIGASPEGLALSDDEGTLYVANASVNAVAVVQLAAQPTGKNGSKLLGLIPTGRYPSAVAVVGNSIFIANGKGTGIENSSVRVNETGLYPNTPNKDFPAGAGNKRGMYSVAAVSGDISIVGVPDPKRLFEYSQTVLKNGGLIGRADREIFPGGRSPFKHVIYVIRENRTYDQVFGDLPRSGDGGKADGDASLAIFGNGDSARSPTGEPQSITPNARELALRFGLFDRFFVNAEASPDGHNWSTAAFSSDYIDKAFRWNYSRRGRGYDFEGFNRLPSFDPPSGQPPVALPPVFDIPASANDIANFQKKYIPYLNGARDIGEPETLYLWDAAERAGITYRNYGEFISTVSVADVQEVNTRKPKKYPDISPIATAFPTKKSLEGHFSSKAPGFDMSTPDIVTTNSYISARQTAGRADPAVTIDNRDASRRGTSRYGAWSEEFQGFVDDLKTGKGDKLPNLSIIRLSNDHTAGLKKGTPTPQFYVAENDYALGRIVEDVSNSPYWADTAIFVLEDDAQDGPDHVDAHRSPALVISAYNRPGALIHEFHNTVSLIRTIELCLGIEPMNFLDANAVPMDIFRTTPDLRPFSAKMPDVALDNVYPPDKPSAKTAYFMDLTNKQDLRHADVANPVEMNEIIWFSVKGGAEMPGVARLPAFDLMKAGMNVEGSATAEPGE